MFRYLLPILFTTFIGACGELPERQAADADVDDPIQQEPTMSVQQATGNGGSNNYIPCQYSTCNGPLDKTVKVSNPARQDW